MATDVPIRCTCGSFRGVARGVSADRGNRLICYCDDCQSFAYFLGRADEVLDAHGGTDIFQMSPARFEIAEGGGQLACMRLSSGGLRRWYAECCKTPLCNTLGSSKVPFVGVIHACLERDSHGSLDAALGAARGGVQGRFARGNRDALDAHDRAPLALVIRFLRVIAMARLRGDQARSPFFDAKTGRPTVEPRVLREEERREVEAARDRGRADGRY